MCVGVTPLCTHRLHRRCDEPSVDRRVELWNTTLLESDLQTTTTAAALSNTARPYRFKAAYHPMIDAQDHKCDSSLSCQRFLPCGTCDFLPSYQWCSRSHPLIPMLLLSNQFQGAFAESVSFLEVNAYALIISFSCLRPTAGWWRMTRPSISQSMRSVSRRSKRSVIALRRRDTQTGGFLCHIHTPCRTHSPPHQTPHLSPPLPSIFRPHLPPLPLHEQWLKLHPRTVYVVSPSPTPTHVITTMNAHTSITRLDVPAV